MITTRADEPSYAKLDDVEGAERNRYGNLIRLTAVDDNGESLCINGDSGIGINPNRTKQHAFHFNADNCIGCHACEAACSEKNDLPPHLSFRSVGYVEGGSYPDYTRINFSMACNHCDDPVCLKGCPTRAYTKHAEYGAVIQDPDICFGCGYCTWVCPYNAPQLDTTAGHVEKCNMCVDRLEVGLKPACVSACLGNALEFGVAESLPAGQQQIETTIPGFPDPNITKPNIRFQQLANLPRELTRTDTEPVKYFEGEPTVDRTAGEAENKHWNLRRLSSRENPLVVFTLAVQAAVGMTLLGFLSSQTAPSLSSFYGSTPYIVMLVVALAMIGCGLLASTLHLGKSLRFYRGFNNLRHSWVAREGLATVVFGALVVGHGMCLAFDMLVIATALGYLAVLGGLCTIYFMYRCYRIPARPFWDHWQTGAAFWGDALLLGSWGAAAFASVMLSEIPDLFPQTAAFAIAVQALGLYGHARDMPDAREGGASHYVQTTTFGRTYQCRLALLAGTFLGCIALIVSGLAHPLWLAGLTLSSLIAATIGRALFYVLVIPTTMPGAFFWKNKSFENHAREIGLAANPQVGIAPVGH